MSSPHTIKLGANPQHIKTSPASCLLQETSTAQVCDFDELLCAFIFRCLQDNSSLESLQNDIEKLERSDNLDQGQKSDLGRLRNQRDDALQNYLEQCLEAVLTVANDESVRSLLSEYLRSFSGVETNRYGPYVNLCNKALSLLRTTNLPLRSPTAPDLQYRRLDPSVLKTHTGADHVHRKPDVGNAGDSPGPQLDQSPDRGAEPEFDAFLGFEEFKAIGSPSEEARAAVESAFTTTARRVRVRPQDNEIDEVQLSLSTSPSPNVSATPPATSSRSSKRKLEATNSVTSSKKLRLGVKNGVALRKESSNEKNFDGRVQCAAYALEMLSQNPGIQHTINLLHIDDCLFIWYYDREGIVRSNGISFIADFPRALVLMALSQRFTIEDWGRCKTFNCPPNTPSFTVSLNDPLLENKYNPHNFLALEIKCSDEDHLSPPPRCLGGRATRVLPCEPKLKDGSRALESLVVKISHPEVRRAHEGKTMKGIRNIAAKYDASMIDHLPGLLCYADVRGTDTGRVRSLVGKPGNVGGFVGDSVRHKVIADWVKATPSQCHKEKASFVKRIRQYSSHVPISFGACYQLATELCWAADDSSSKFARYPATPPIQSLDLWIMFLAALKMTSWRRQVSTSQMSMQELDDAFVAPLIERLEIHQPQFDGLDDSMKPELRQIFLADSQPPALQVKAPKLKDRMNGRQDSRPRSTPPIPPT